MHMITIKHLLCCTTLLTPSALFANTPSVSPVEVKIQVPNPGWKLQIEQIHTTESNKLLVICSVNKADGMHASVISHASDLVKVPTQLAKLPRQIYLLGKEWNWGKGYTAIDPNELHAITAGSTQIYTKPAKREIEASDFVGLTLEDATQLADHNKLTFRVVEIDGKPRPATLDMQPERLNFSLKDGKVIAVTKG